MSDTKNRRILIVDDNQSIHDDFAKLLAPRADAERTHELDALADDFFGDDAPSAPAAAATDGFDTRYELSDAMQGGEALEMVQAAQDQGRPFAMAFVDVRMPPGIDGIETTRRLIDIDPNLLVVLCTAFADYSWQEIVEQLGRPERYLILKKPFDAIEVQQLAATLTAKWQLAMEKAEHLDELKSYAASLEAVNSNLKADKQLADLRAADQARFLHGAGSCFHRAAVSLEEQLAKAGNMASAPVQEARLASRNLAAGLSELGELSSIEAGTHRPRPRRTETQTLLAELGAYATLRAEQSERACQLTPELQLPPQLEIDLERTLIAARALVDWALANSNAGGISIHCATRTSDSVCATDFSIAVEGDGSPLDADQREALFRPFQDDERSHVRDLALPLARRLAERLGGSFDFDSQRSGHFRLTLHVDPGPVEESVAMAWPQAPHDSQAA